MDETDEREEDAVSVDQERMEGNRMMFLRMTIYPNGDTAEGKRRRGGEKKRGTKNGLTESGVASGRKPSWELGVRTASKRGKGEKQNIRGRGEAPEEVLRKRHGCRCRCLVVESG